MEGWKESIGWVNIGDHAFLKIEGVVKRVENFSDELAVNGLIAMGLAFKVISKIEELEGEW